VGSAFIFLAAEPTKAHACNATCYATTCILQGNVYCENGQYTYSPQYGGCSGGLPGGCSGGSGGWQWEQINGNTSCMVGCVCPYSNYPTQWEVTGGG
jgi:hypothetical protein